MNKIVTGFLLFVISLGSIFVLPIFSFIILTNKWMIWVEKNMKDIIKTL